MAIVRSIPSVPQLDAVVDTLGRWQRDNAPVQLHPGDLGWNSLQGVEQTAAALRIWSHGGTMLALGLLNDELLRMALDPDLTEDDELARAIVADIEDPSAGVLSTGSAAIEARGALRVSQLLLNSGWRPDELSTPLRLDLSAPIEDVGVHVETVYPDRAEDWIKVHWSAFRGTPLPGEARDRNLGKWLTMAKGLFYTNARSLAAMNPEGQMVAVATVWSAGPGRPGLLEPVGVHRDHQGNGYGKAITLASARALREMGSSCALVCTPSANAGAVATYVSAGFTAEEPVADLQRAG